MLTLADALRLTTVVGALGVIVGSLERLRHPRLLADGALVSWPVATASNRLLAGRAFRRTVGRLLDYPTVLVLVGICLACAVALVVGIGPGLAAVAAVVVAATYVLLGMRSRFGGDGADQMTILLFTSLALAFAVGQERAAALVLWFIAAQAALSYVTAGIAKLVSPMWRDGSALRGIMGTSSYGHPWAARFLAARPRLATAASWSVITVECLFPLALLGIRPLTWALVGCGVLFHLGTAILMRLNTFFAAFVATYPAVLFCAATVGGW
jgi:hypothetical protein